MDIVLWSDLLAAFCAGYDDAYEKMGRKVYFDFDQDSCTQNFIDVRYFRDSMSLLTSTIISGSTEVMEATYASRCNRMRVLRY